MDNHYHLVLHTRQANLSRLMQKMNGVYTQAYNRRHGKVGHLFQGRFKGILVDGNEYLLEVSRYVDLNPVRARLVRDPANWAWSSYRAHIGRAEIPEWLDTPALHGILLGRDVRTAADGKRAARHYLAFVAAGKGVKLWDEALRHQIFLGSEDFVVRMQALIEADALKDTGIPRLQRKAPKRTITQYLADKHGRDAGIVRAAREGQYSLTAIGRDVGLSVSRVSRIVLAAEANRRGETK